jgi:hypothetical protein
MNSRSEKRTSLLFYSINYDRKNVYDIAPWFNAVRKLLNLMPSLWVDLLAQRILSGRVGKKTPAYLFGRK